MRKRYYIVRLSQIGNVGPHEIKKVSDQPEDGFDSEEDAEKILFKLHKAGKLFYNWNNWAIMPLYSMIK